MVTCEYDKKMNEKIKNSELYTSISAKFDNQVIINIINLIENFSTIHNQKGRVALKYSNLSFYFINI